MIKINDELLTKITTDAKVSSRKRKNYNFHKQSTDLLQRMLNAIDLNTYVQPHKHESPDKREVFIILKGKALIIEFNSEGEIIDYIILDRNTNNFAVEIPPGIYHTIISLEDGTVVYEIKDGPYDEVIDKHFAEWAPEEKSARSQDYLKSLINNLNINLL